MAHLNTPTSPNPDKLPIRALPQPRRAYCERILCMQASTEDPGWWHQLEHLQQLPFAQGGRIVEVPLAETAKAIEDTAKAGYRPIVFVSSPAHWPKVFAALGRYRTFGRIYTLGNDDEVMSELIHQPSADVVAAYYHGGKVILPSPEYGKALEEFFEIRLEDFYRVSIDQKDPLKPRVSIACRINPFRRIDLTLYVKDGIMNLKQYYLPGSTGESETCRKPLRFGPWRFEFSSGEPFNTRQLPEPERMLVTQAIAEHFDLPLAYRGWAPGRSSPWEELRRRLVNMSTNVMQHLTAVQEALLDLVAWDQLDLHLEPAQAYRVQGDRSARRQGDGSDAEKKIVKPVLLTRINLPDDKRTPRSVTFRVRWPEDGKPQTEPAVSVEAAGETQPEVEAEWSEDLSRLTLTPTHHGLAAAEFGWIWAPERGTLRLSFDVDEPA